MPKPKRSITRDNVFRTTAEAPTPSQGIGAEEPKTRQTAVWFADEETDWVDVKLRDIKKSGWRGVTRSAFIRALVRAAKSRNVDVTGVTGEAELEQRLSLK